MPPRNGDPAWVGDDPARVQHRGDHLRVGVGRSGAHGAGLELDPELRGAGDEARVREQDDGQSRGQPVGEDLAGNERLVDGGRIGAT